LTNAMQQHLGGKVPLLSPSSSPDGAKQPLKSEAKSAIHDEPALELGHDAHRS
jgi:hypothetical protein